MDHTIMKFFQILEISFGTFTIHQLGNTTFPENLSCIRFCGALFADNFDKKKFSISSINNYTTIKILKNVLALVDRTV